MRVCDHAGKVIRQWGIDLVATGKIVECRALVEPSHLDRPFDRGTSPADREMSVGLLRDRHSAQINARREWPVHLHLGFAGGLAFLETGEVEEGEFDRALDLV